MAYAMHGKIVGFGTVPAVPPPPVASPPTRQVPPPPVASPPRPGAQQPPDAQDDEAPIMGSMGLKVAAGVGVAVLFLGFFAWMARRHGT